MRLQGNDIPLARTLQVGLSKYSSALLVKGKARKKPHKFFTEAVDDIINHSGEQGKAEATSKAAFLTVPGLLQESIDDIFVLREAETTIPVYIRCNEKHLQKTSQFILIADGEDIAQSESFFGAVAIYIEAFYVFNLSYPASLLHSLTFVQKIILNIQDEFRPTKPIITLTNKLNIVNK